MTENCSFCHSTNITLSGRSEHFTFLACPECCLQFVYPMPLSTDLLDLYNNFSAGKRVREEFQDYVTLAKRVLNHQIKRLDSYGFLVSQSPRFLDVGCGGGHFLVAAQEMGFEVYGVELDSAAVEACRERGLSHVQYGSLEDVPFPSDYFDIVKAMHVLEHCVQPLSLLKEICRILRSGGYLLLDVPNQASLMAKFKILLYCLGLEKQDYGYLQPPAHLYAFTSNFLRICLSQLGFKIKEIVRTSPLDPNYFAATPNYFGSWQGKIRKTLYALIGTGSYISIYSIKS